MADSLWVDPIVTVAEVDPHHTTCPECGALMVRLAWEIVSNIKQGHAWTHVTGHQRDVS